MKQTIDPLRGLVRWLGIVLLLGSLQGAETPTASTTNTDGSVTIAPAPKLARYLGRWSGKWDGIWAVHFTVTASSKTNEVRVLYEWEENAGQPLRSARHTCRVVGDSLKIGTHIVMDLDPKDSEKTSVLGRFAESRTADLLREKP